MKRRVKAYSNQEFLNSKNARALRILAEYLEPKARFEKYRIDDFSYRGFSYTPLYTTGVAVLMGGDLPPAYQTNVFFVRLKLGL